MKILFFKAKIHDKFVTVPPGLYCKVSILINFIVIILFKKT